MDIAAFCYNHPSPAAVVAHISSCSDLSFEQCFIYLDSLPAFLTNTTRVVDFPLPVSAGPHSSPSHTSPLLASHAFVHVTSISYSSRCLVVSLLLPLLYEFTR